jgi:hypothetical protein
VHELLMTTRYSWQGAADAGVRAGKWRTNNCIIYGIAGGRSDSITG